MTIDRDFVKRVSEEIERLAQTIDPSFKVSVRRGKVNFDPMAGTMEIKLNVGLIDANGTVASPERAAFTQFAADFGLDPTWLDKTFTFAGGRQMTVIGLRPRSPKKNILTLDPKNGQQYITTSEALKYAATKGVAA